MFMPLGCGKSLGFFQGACATAKTLAQIIDPTAVPAAAEWAIVQAESQECRWRMDGTAPTAAIGIILAVKDSVFVHKSQFATFKMIEVTGTAKVNLEFFQSG